MQFFFPFYIVLIVTTLVLVGFSCNFPSERVSFHSFCESQDHGILSGWVIPWMCLLCAKGEFVALSTFPLPFLIYRLYLLND